MTYKHRENHATKMKKPEFRFKIKDADPKGRFRKLFFQSRSAIQCFSWPFHIALCIRLPTPNSPRPCTPLSAGAVAKRQEKEETQLGTFFHRPFPSSAPERKMIFPLQTLSARAPPQAPISILRDFLTQALGLNSRVHRCWQTGARKSAAPPVNLEQHCPLTGADVQCQPDQAHAKPNSRTTCTEEREPHSDHW